MDKFLLEICRVAKCDPYATLEHVKRLIEILPDSDREIIKHDPQIKKLLEK